MATSAPLPFFTRSDDRIDDHRMANRQRALTRVLTRALTRASEHTSGSTPIRQTGGSRWAGGWSNKHTSNTQ